MSNAKMLAKMLMVAGGLSMATAAAPAMADAPCGPSVSRSSGGYNPCSPCATVKKKKAKKAAPCAANPCAANPCAANPCAANPCAANPCKANPCKANPCAANPCKANPCKPIA
jgi:hypothetical protein